MTSAILTDIEGTTSSISFVKDVLFPYARRELPGFVREHAEEPAVRHWLGHVKLELAGEDFSDETLIATLVDWIDSDRKHTALKALQGMIWKAGYRAGEFAAHVYPDAAQALVQWYQAGHDLFVYSSGSVPSQKLFFSHSSAGDLTPLFSGYFDTEIGSKRETGSYRRILASMQRPADAVVFLSDVVPELDAAREAGMRTVLLDRPEDYAEPRIGEAANGHVRVTSFDEITP